MDTAYGTVPALERLTQLTNIDISQTSSGGLRGCSYKVLSGNEVMFNLVEDSSSTGLFSGGSNRLFHMDGIDNTGRKLFWLRRHRTCAWMSDKLELYIDDALIAVIRREVTCTAPIFSISDAQNRLTLRVKRNISDLFHFRLQTATKTDIGTLDRKWQGWMRAMTSLKSDYTINFPTDLSMHCKLAVIAACIYIDFKLFEG